MLAKIADYSDYHRTIIGFHGTTAETADRLVSGESFRESDQDDEWFGKGVYFWEYVPKQAWWWAEKQKRHRQPAVVGAIIRLGNCSDLLDPQNIPVLREFHADLLDSLKQSGQKIPINVRTHRNLDCAVFNYLYNYSEKMKKPIESARAVYVPTSSAERIWQGSWIYDQAHIQICVRKPRNILADWHVRRNGRYGKDSPTPSESHHG